MYRIILASASPRRSELLKQLNIEFEVRPSATDEEIGGNLSPEKFVEELSRRKAGDVAAKQDGKCLVIGADTIVVKGGVMLGKPSDPEHARKMLRELSNSWHEVITGVTIIETPGMEALTFHEKTRVKMRDMSDSMIDAYIRTGEPLDKAGAYGIQGLGAVFVEEIHGCYFNVVGLPLAKLTLMLEKFGVRIL